MLDPRILMLGKIGWRYAGHLATFYAFQTVCLWMLGSMLVGHPLGLHGFEHFVHYIFSYVPAITAGGPGGN